MAAAEYNWHVVDDEPRSNSSFISDISFEPSFDDRSLNLLDTVSNLAFTEANDSKPH